MRRNFTLLSLFISFFILTGNAIAQTTTYAATGAIQTYTVPAGVTAVTINIKGASGGGVYDAFTDYQSRGGCGAQLQGTVAVTAGQILNIVVGKEGSSGSATATMALGGYGGGGSDSAFSTIWPGAGGGGGTFIIDNATGDTLAVAGGGGGGGGFESGSDNGGAGGNATAANGASFECGATGGGGGGTPTAGGSGSTCDGDEGSSGTYGQGGSYPTTGFEGAGGGGGGWYGGGAGASGAGGGGGSSYYNSTYVSGAILSAGVTCAGNGVAVIISPCTGPSSVSASISPSPACSGDTLTLTGSATGATTYSWTGPGGFTSTLESPTISSVTTIASGEYIFTAYDSILCPAAATASVTVNATPLVPLVTPTSDTICNGSSFMLRAITTPDTLNLFPNESWESGVPGTAGTTVDGWNYIGATASDWIQKSGAATANPATTSAEAGTYVAQFSSHTVASGGTATLESPFFSLSGITGAKLTFWVYRDVTAAYNTATYNAEAISVYANTSATTTGATLLGRVPRRGSRAITTPLTGTSTTTTSGWYQYTVTIPATYAGYSSGTNYILFTGTSRHGDNQYLDNITLTGIESVTTTPTWSPTTYLYTDAALTTPYSGAATDTVYVYPTGLSATTTETYSDVVTAGGCSASNTSTVTITATTASVSGTTSLCTGGSTVITFSGTSGSTLSYNINGGSTLTTTIGSTGTATVATGSLTSTTTYYLTNVTSGSCSNPLYDSAVITVDITPSSITGDSVICVGSTSSLSSSPPGGTWSIGTGGTAVASIGSSTGILGGLSAGTAHVTYTASSGCVSATTATVDALPTVYSMTGTGTTSYCAGSSGIDLGLSGSATGVSYQLFNSGSSVGAAKAGTGSALDFGYQTSAGSYNVVATNTVTGCQSNMSGSASVTINTLPTVFAVTGGGAYCSGSTGVSIGLDSSASGIHYQLYRGATAIGTAVSGTGSSFTFGTTFTTAGTYTVLATNATTGCTSDMSDSAVISINPLPAAFAMTGGGSYCAGDTGKLIGLAGSATGIAYQLYNGATAEGAAVAGTGAAISFGYQTTAGTYTVIGTNTVTGCTRDMTGSESITINPQPTIYSVTGGGPYCAGGTGVPVGLSGSTSPITYKLYKGTTLIGTPYTGTGSAFNFGSETSGGTYSVVAVNTTTGCADTMTGSATVIIEMLPVAYTVTESSPAYCAGGAGVDIMLSNSDTGISYQLFNGGTATGTPLAGTGSGLNYGYVTSGGYYKVIATNTVTTCPNNMADSVDVTINPLPTVYGVSDSGVDFYCAGGTGVAVNLSGSQSGINYTFVDTTGFDTTVAGTGAPIITHLTTAGTYTVYATNTATGCTNNMSGTGTVIIYVFIPDSVVLSTAAKDTVCTGAVVTFTATPSGGGASPAYQWYVNSLPAGTDSNTYTYMPDSGDVVTVTLTSSYPCGAPRNPQATTTVTVLPYGLPSVFITAEPVYSVCAGTPVTFTPATTYTGYQPVFTWIVDSTIDGTGPTFTYVPGNDDTVSAILASNYQCRIADSAYSNKRIMHVTPLLVPTLDLLPEPSSLVTIGEHDTLVAIVHNGGSDPVFQWYIGDVAISGATNSIFIDTSVHTGDSVSCQVTNSGICAGITTYNWVILNAFPEQVQQQAAAVTNIQLMPNPNRGAFTIKGSWAAGGSDDAIAEITDMAGRVLYTGQVKTIAGQMNEHLSLGAAFANGVYFITIHRNNESKTFQFVIQQ